MFARFFIDRPIFASVLSIVITLAGGVAVFALPVAQYPDVTPPTVQVTASYPGANANTLRDTVAAPIEEQVSGVEGMLYMASNSGNDGSYSLTVTFDVGTVFSTTLNVAVPPASVVNRPEVGDTVICGASLSRLITVTSAAFRLL